jgi:hypothetical protein
MENKLGIFQQRHLMKDEITTHILLFTLTFCHCQVTNYDCNFDNDFAEDCQFTVTSGTVSLTLESGSVPGGTPGQPLSDVSSIRKFFCHQK